MPGKSSTNEESFGVAALDLLHRQKEDVAELHETASYEVRYFAKAFTSSR